MSYSKFIRCNDMRMLQIITIITEHYIYYLYMYMLLYLLLLLGRGYRGKPKTAAESLLSWPGRKSRVQSKTTVAFFAVWLSILCVLTSKLIIRTFNTSKPLKSPPADGLFLTV